MTYEEQLVSLKKSKNFYVYIYEWIDLLDFCKVSNLNPQDAEYQIITTAFRHAGCKGDGILTEIWIPPFAVGAILEEPINYADELWKSWQNGLILWHVKQREDGLSFIGSPKKLLIPDVGIDKVVS